MEQSYCSNLYEYLFLFTFSLFRPGLVHLIVKINDIAAHVRLVKIRLGGLCLTSLLTRSAVAKPDDASRHQAADTEK